MNGEMTQELSVRWCDKWPAQVPTGWVREAQRLSGLWSYLTSIVLALVMVVC